MTPEQERTYQIINTITLMDKKIDLCEQKLECLKIERELHRQELIKRFPDLEKIRSIKREYENRRLCKN